MGFNRLIFSFNTMRGCLSRALWSFDGVRLGFVFHASEPSIVEPVNLKLPAGCGGSIPSFSVLPIVGIPQGVWVLVMHLHWHASNPPALLDHGGINQWGGDVVVFRWADVVLMSCPPRSGRKKFQPSLGILIGAGRLVGSPGHLRMD